MTMWSLRFVLWPPSLLGCGGRLISKQFQKFLCQSFCFKIAVPEILVSKCLFQNFSFKILVPKFRFQISCVKVFVSKFVFRKWLSQNPCFEMCLSIYPKWHRAVATGLCNALEVKTKYHNPHTPRAAPRGFEPLGRVWANWAFTLLGMLPSFFRLSIIFSTAFGSVWLTATSLMGMA